MGGNDDGIDIEIKELDTNLIKPSPLYSESEGGSKIVVIGKAGTGKSRLIMSLMYEKNTVLPYSVIMSGTESETHFYEKHFPKTFIHYSFSIKKIENIIKRQKLMIEHSSSRENQWLGLIIDDCMDDPKQFTHPVINALYKNGRHWRMFFIMALQYCIDVKPAIRANVDGVFILRETSPVVRKKIYDNFGGTIPTYDMFCKLLDAITVDYTALYIHNSSTSNDWRDCVFWYKAKNVPSTFKFGNQYYWSHHKDRCEAK